MGGGGDGEKTKKKFMQGKMPRKTIRAKKKGKKKIHAEGRSNCDFYLIYKICQVPIKKSSYSKYSWGPTPGPPIVLIINRHLIEYVEVFSSHCMK